MKKVFLFSFPSNEHDPDDPHDSITQAARCASTNPASLPLTPHRLHEGDSRPRWPASQAPLRAKIQSLAEKWARQNQSCPVCASSLPPLTPRRPEGCARGIRGQEAAASGQHPRLAASRPAKHHSVSRLTKPPTDMDKLQREHSKELFIHLLSLFSNKLLNCYCFYANKTLV